MTCDRCTEEAIWMPSETACMTAHCDECLANCRYCMDDLADQATEEGAA